MNGKRLGVAVAGVVVLAMAAWLLLPAPLEVDGAPVETGALQLTVDDLGETRSHDRFVLSAPVAGRLERIALHDGDAVQDNQLVARIAAVPLSTRDRTELMARVASAEATQREVEQRARQSEHDLSQARRELERARQLARQGFIAAQGLETATHAEATAVAAWEAARFRVRAAAADVKVARAGLEAARMGQPGQEWIEVRAPMAGRLLRIHDASERVVAVGEPLMVLGDVSRLEIVIPLLSTDAVKVAPGMPVLIEGWGGSQALRATVRLVEPYGVTKVSALGIEEKRVNVIADFVDPPKAIGDGFRLTARIVTWEADQVLKIPASALFRCEQAWCVFVVEAGRAHRRTVELGQRNLLEAQIKRGLRPGDMVVRHPSNALHDGARVRLPSP